MYNKNDWERKLSPLLRNNKFVKRSSFGRVIIELTGKGNDRIHSEIQTLGGEIIKENKLVPSIVAQLPLEALSEIARSDQVKKIWSDSEVKIL